MSSDSVPRPLTENFRRHGHEYRLIKRSGTVAWFAVHFVNEAGAAAGVCGHEIVRVRIAKEGKLPGGKVAPLRETYPGDEDFGTHGWYYDVKQLDEAAGKFQSLCLLYNVAS